MHQLAAIIFLILLALILLVPLFFIRTRDDKIVLTALIVAFIVGCLLGYFLFIQFSQSQVLILSIIAAGLLLIPSILRDYGYANVNLMAFLGFIGITIIVYILTTIIFHPDNIKWSSPSSSSF